MNKKFHFPMTGKKAAWMIAAGVTLAGLESAGKWGASSWRSA